MTEYKCESIHAAPIASEILSQHARAAAVCFVPANFVAALIDAMNPFFNMPFSRGYFYSPSRLPACLLVVERACCVADEQIFLVHEETNLRQLAGGTK